MSFRLKSPSPTPATSSPTNQSINQPAAHTLSEPLSVKVLRLHVPSIAKTNYVDWQLDSINQSTNQSINQSLSMLTVPLSMGAVYTGQLFRACVSVRSMYEAAVSHPDITQSLLQSINQSNDQVINGVNVLIELQTANARIPLIDTSINQSTGLSLEAGKLLTFVVSHSPTEPGTHCLVVTLKYDENQSINQSTNPTNNDPLSSSPNNQSNNQSVKTLQKYFKFAVTDPFLVSHHSIKLDGINQSTSQSLNLIDCSIVNQMDRPVILQPPTFDINQSINQSIRHADTLQPRAKRNFLIPFDTSTNQSTNQSLSPTNQSISQSKTLGRALIVYASSMGEIGRFYTTPINRPAIIQSINQSANQPINGSISQSSNCRIVSCPSQVKLEQPFDVQLELSVNQSINQSVKQFSLLASRDRMGSLVPYGLQTATLQPINQSNNQSNIQSNNQWTHQCQLTFVAVNCGLHKLSGLCIADTSINQSINQSASTSQSTNQNYSIVQEFAPMGAIWVTAE